MSSHSASFARSADRADWVSLLLRRELWGGITLVTIWLGVLFVGIFGGTIETHSSDGSGGSFPVVIIVAIVALLATMSVGRWAFGHGGQDSRADQPGQAG